MVNRCLRSRRVSLRSFGLRLRCAVSSSVFPRVGCMSVCMNRLVLVVFAEEVVNLIVEGGAIPALVKHLQAPPLIDRVQKPLPFEHEVEKGSAFALGLLAVKVISFFSNCYFRFYPIFNRLHLVGLSLF